MSLTANQQKVHQCLLACPKGMSYSALKKQILGDNATPLACASLKRSVGACVAKKAAVSTKGTGMNGSFKAVPLKVKPAKKVAPKKKATTPKKKVAVKKTAAKKTATPKKAAKKTAKKATKSPKKAKKPATKKPAAKKPKPAAKKAKK